MSQLTTLDSNLPLTEVDKCLVCGKNVGTDRAVCRSCDTPSYTECRDYIKGCPVYDCKGMADALTEVLTDIAPRE